MLNYYLDDLAEKPMPMYPPVQGLELCLATGELEEAGMVRWGDDNRLYITPAGITWGERSPLRAA